MTTEGSNPPTYMAATAPATCAQPIPTHAQPASMQPTHIQAQAAPVYAQPQGAGVTTIVVSTGFGHAPTMLKCPACHHHGLSKTTKESGDCTFLAAAVGCFIGGLLCVWIPFLIDGSHYQNNIWLVQLVETLKIPSIHAKRVELL